MNEYLYLLRGGDEARIAAKNDPEAWGAHMMQWKTWIESLEAKGHLSGGQPLADSGRVLREKAKKVTDGPFIEGKEIVGGYLLIKAKDLDEATEIAKDCPHFVYGKSVEIREVKQLAM
ncbi:MAG TPA: YciI family protein [Candidatus Kapabacteria bacterium]|nr:YciI family protein [Candidatus Kapabacteria bacterium]